MLGDSHQKNAQKLVEEVKLEKYDEEKRMILVELSNIKEYKA